MSVFSVVGVGVTIGLVACPEFLLNRACLFAWIMSFTDEECEDFDVDSVTDEISNSYEEMLIDSVRAFPCLWDLSVSAFHDHDAKQNAWLEVAAACGHSSMLCG